MDIRIKNLANTATKLNTSLTLDYLAVDKASPDRTEKITPGVLFSMDETKVPFIGQNYVIINAKGTDEENYSALLAGLTLVNTLTPNGLPQSATNRATLYLLGGRYVTASSVVALAPLKFVNIIGIGDRDAIVIGSNSSQPVIKLANDNLNVFKNFTIINAGGGESFGWNTGQTDNSIMDNLIIGSKTTANVLLSGKYSKIKAESDFVLQGGCDSALFEDCNFKNYSCGYSNTGATYLLNTIVKRTVGLAYCFSATDAISGGATIDGCIFDDVDLTGGFGFGYCDAGNVLIANSYFNNCGKKYPSESCFGSTLSGSINCTNTIFENSEATLLSFGNTSANSKLISCKRTGSYGVHAGFIEKCDFVGDLFISAGATVRRCDIDQGKVNASTAISAKVYLNSFDQIIDANITNLIDTPYNVVDADI